MANDQQKQKTTTSSDEIDLIELARTFWAGRRTLFKTIGICAVLGLLIAIFSPKEFTASTTLVPQEADAQSKLGGLSGLASMAGINLNMGSTSDITPTVYPQIVASIPFQLSLMKMMLNFKDISQPISLYDYYTSYKKPNPFIKYTVGLPGTIMKAIKGKPQEVVTPGGDNGPIALTMDQRDVQKRIKDLVTIDYNDKDGYVTISCNLPEALPAAQLAQRTQELLQQYITEFKIQKAKANLDFVQQRYDEVKKQYELAQDELAGFQDKNRNVFTATAQTELQRLQNNYTLIYNVYSGLAQQLEQAKIQVKEDTPVFTIIEPVSVPLEKSKPNRPLILVIWIFLGGIIGTGTIFGRKFLTEIKKRWNNPKRTSE